MSELLKVGKEVLRKEAEAIVEVMERLGPDFDQVVKTINACSGRVVFTGIGKSGLIAKKIASTFSSIGIPAVYLPSCRLPPRRPRHDPERGRLLRRIV